MRSGFKAEQLERKHWERMGYHCRIFPKAKWYAQDLFGFDVICVNRNQWVLVQVKSSRNRIPALETKTMKEMLATPMPPETARFWVGYNFKMGKVRREQVG